MVYFFYEDSFSFPCNAAFPLQLIHHTVKGCAAYGKRACQPVVAMRYADRSVFRVLRKVVEQLIRNRGDAMLSMRPVRKWMRSVK